MSLDDRKLEVLRAIKRRSLARRRREGWDSWGNEADKFATLTSEEDAADSLASYNATIAEIGKRVSNTKNYADAFKRTGKKTSAVPKFGDFEKESFAQPQPLRTDLERMLQESRGFVDVEMEA